MGGWVSRCVREVERGWKGRERRVGRKKRRVDGKR